MTRLRAMSIAVSLATSANTNKSDSMAVQPFVSTVENTEIRFFTIRNFANNKADI